MSSIVSAIYSQLNEGLAKGPERWTWVYRKSGIAYLGKGTVVPQVALVGEAVANKAKLALLDVLLDGVEELLLGDLREKDTTNVSMLKRAVPKTRGSKRGGGGRWTRSKSDALVSQLKRQRRQLIQSRSNQLLQLRAHLKLAVSPSRNLDNHVQDGLLLVGVERNVVEGGHGDAILLDVDAVLQSVLGGNLADGVSRHRGGLC